MPQPAWLVNNGSRGAVTAAAALALVMLVLGILVGMAGSRMREQPEPAPLAPEEVAYGLPAGLEGELSLIVLAGQSNMSGFGRADGEDRTDHRAFVFSNDYRWRPAREPLDHDVGQVDTVSRDRRAGTGPGLAFALSLLEKQPDLRLGLIPCARSSSAIRQWQRNLSDQSLYGSCLKRIRAASTVGRIAGILFFQGESDALDPEQYPRFEPAGLEYDGLFTRFVAEFRADVGDPLLPFVFAQIATQTTDDAYIYWDAIKEQQRRATLPCAAMIVTEDLPLSDGLHFTTAAYRRVGIRFADAFHQLTREGC